MSILQLVDDGNLSKLFLEELGWNAPNQDSLTVSCTDGKAYVVDEIAEFKGMGIWVCKDLPDPSIQREIDTKVAGKTTERLTVFTDGTNQEWRWPRYRTNQRSGHPTLVPQRHVKGSPNPQLRERLEMIQIPFESSITVPELLHRMRNAFDTEAEIASRGAARLMGDLYQHLEASGMDDEMSSIFLARMLFLMFGDDTEMWSQNIFYNFISQGTKPDGSDLIDKLNQLFLVADTDVKDRQESIDPLLESLPYINGGIFASPIDISASEPAELRESLISASKFDWSQISPAVFGSMFQTVKSRVYRRSLGEHYTSEENILKALRPLFLDDLNAELDSSWDKPKDLEKLREKLARIKVLDPACGCGNFLIVAYRELREIELEILKRLRDIAPIGKKEVRGQQATDATIGLNVTVEQFYGIEIESWPARIAETAMFLVDHQSNVRMEGELGGAPRRLPIDLSPHIYLGSALTVPWDSLVNIDENTYIVGNPPFIGARLQTPEQKAETKLVWGKAKGVGEMDFVSNWHVLASQHISRHGGQAAFVSTNSLTQGEQPGILWTVLKPLGMSISFAHRTFAWSNDAQGQAAVHCVILGLTNSPPKKRLLWSYADIKGQPSVDVVSNINGFLLSAPDVIIANRSAPLSIHTPQMALGSMPNDGGYLSDIDATEADRIRKADPVAGKYLRRLLGARELIHNEERFCLWLEHADPHDLRTSSELSNRILAVRNLRAESKREATRKLASKSAEFGEVRQPKSDYLAVPFVSSEDRDYLQIAVVEKSVIANNRIAVIQHDSLDIFGIMVSRVFTAWNKAVSGRLESRLNLSVTITYNNFPFPSLDKLQKENIEKGAEKVLAARESFPLSSLADLYGASSMPPDLRKAHEILDATVLHVFGISEDATEDVILARLFELHEGLISNQSSSNSLF
jgi:hypothetical protein